MGYLPEMYEEFKQQNTKPTFIQELPARGTSVISNMGRILAS